MLAPRENIKLCKKLATDTSCATLSRSKRARDEKSVEQCVVPLRGVLMGRYYGP